MLSCHVTGWLVGLRINSYSSAYWKSLAGFAIEAFHRLNLRGEMGMTSLRVIHAHICIYTAKVLRLYILLAGDLDFIAG